MSEAGVPRFSYLDVIALRQAINAVVEVRTKVPGTDMCAVPSTVPHTRIIPCVSTAGVPALWTQVCAHSRRAIMRIIRHPMMMSLRYLDVAVEMTLERALYPHSKLDN